MGGKTSGELPGCHVLTDFLHKPVAVEIDEIDREAHAHGVDRLAGNNPKPLAGREALTAEQTSSAGGAAVRYVDAARQFRLPGDVPDPDGLGPLA